MPHTRNGKAAKARRQESAKDRATQTAQYLERWSDLTAEERLLEAIFGAHDKCEECFAPKLRRSDCMTPHCKAMREEADANT